MLIDKPNARYFAVTVLAVGLILRGLVQERRAKREAVAIPEKLPIQAEPGLPITNFSSSAGLPATMPAPASVPGSESILCAIRGTGRTLDFALREARETGRRLYLLFVREQPFMTEQDAKRKWPLFAYAVSPSAAETIVDVAATLGASRLILGAPKRNALMNLIRGSVIREVSDLLPEEIDLLVYA